MPNHHSVLIILLTVLVFLSVSCNENNKSSGKQALPTPTKKLQQATSTLPIDTQNGVLPQLFKDAMEPANSAPGASHVVRSRYVHINTDLLLDSNNQVLESASGTQLAINLFPDANYIGMIERVEQNGPDNYSWIGSLQDIEYSRMYIIYTEGVFLAHFASPAGIYEVQLIENDLYRVVEIDQTKLPQE